MKIFAIIMNVALLVIMGMFVISEGAPFGSLEWAFLISCLVAPVVNLCYIFAFSGKSWLGTYFKRKRLEEEKRIEELQEKKKGADSPGGQEN
jgi:hypothetical protein